jgi:hypothetical protein
MGWGLSSPRSGGQRGGETEGGEGREGHTPTPIATRGVLREWRRDGREGTARIPGGSEARVGCAAGGRAVSWGLSLVGARRTRPGGRSASLAFLGLHAGSLVPKYDVTLSGHRHVRVHAGRRPPAASLCRKVPKGAPEDTRICQPRRIGDLKRKERGETFVRRLRSGARGGEPDRSANAHPPPAPSIPPVGGGFLPMGVRGGSSWSEKRLVRPSPPPTRGRDRQRGPAKLRKKPLQSEEAAWKVRGGQRPRLRTCWPRAPGPRTGRPALCSRSCAAVLAAVFLALDWRCARPTRTAGGGPRTRASISRHKRFLLPSSPGMPGRGRRRNGEEYASSEIETGDAGGGQRGGSPFGESAGVAARPEIPPTAPDSITSDGECVRERRSRPTMSGRPGGDGPARRPPPTAGGRAPGGTGGGRGDVCPKTASPSSWVPGGPKNGVTRPKNRPSVFLPTAETRFPFSLPLPFFPFPLSFPLPPFLSFPPLSFFPSPLFPFLPSRLPPFFSPFSFFFLVFFSFPLGSPLFFLSPLSPASPLPSFLSPPPFLPPFPFLSPRFSRRTPLFSPSPPFPPFVPRSPPPPQRDPCGGLRPKRGRRGRRAFLAPAPPPSP